MRKATTLTMMRARQYRSGMDINFFTNKFELNLNIFLLDFASRYIPPKHIIS